MRINKYLALHGFGSRRKVEKLVLDGRVKVNNNRVSDLATRVDSDKDVVFVDNKPIVNSVDYVYYILNKPSGYISTVSDDKGRKTVLDFFKKTNERIYPVGRLDYDTEGLLLLTNDGDIANKLMQPKMEVPKTYIVQTDNKLTANDLGKLKNGIILDDGYKTKKAIVRIIKAKENFSKIKLTIFEGKNRQVRRMFEALDKRVTKLKRISVGDITLGNIKTGEYRSLNKNDINYLKKL